MFMNVVLGPLQGESGWTDLPEQDFTKGFLYTMFPERAGFFPKFDSHVFAFYSGLGRQASATGGSESRAPHAWTDG